MKMQKLSNFLKNLTSNEQVCGFILLAPCLIGTFIFIIIPIFASFSLSFFEWDLINLPKFVGLKNYAWLFNSPQFYQILTNTLIFAICITVLGVIIPLILATIINSKIRGSEFFKTAFFLPFITPMVVVAIIWEWIFDPSHGLLNYLLKTNIEWLYSPKTAMLAIILVSVWKLIGYNMIIFLSGFSAINQSVFEQAKIDGASKPKTFFKITIPLLSPTILFVIIITTISSLQVFDLICLMTKGGPLNSTNVLVYWLYQNAFEYFQIGKASSVAYVLFTIIFMLTISQWNIRKKWVYNED